MDKGFPIYANLVRRQGDGKFLAFFNVQVADQIDGKIGADRGLAGVLGRQGGAVEGTQEFQRFNHRRHGVFGVRRDAPGGYVLGPNADGDGVADQVDNCLGLDNAGKTTLTERILFTSGKQSFMGEVDDGTATMDFLAEALAKTAEERDKVVADAETALLRADEMATEIRLMEEKNDMIFRQLEDAMKVSVEPLDKMFEKAGMDPDSIIDEVRRGYSGQGGPLTPLSFSTRGEELGPDASRANDILGQMDRLNMYRIAAQKVPFASPIKDAFRFTSGFGRRWGRIISINTIGIHQPGPNYHAYTAAKTAMLGFTRNLAVEVGAYNITANIVSPGLTLTQEVKAMLTQEAQEKHENRVPLRRTGTVEDTANAALFFASELSSFVTGHYMPVCGGQVLE